MTLEKSLFKLKQVLQRYPKELKNAEISIETINENNLSELRTKVSSMPNCAELVQLITKIESLKAANDECDFFDSSQFEVKNTGIQR